MRKRLLDLLCISLGLLVFGIPGAWANTSPVVTNVTASQRIDGSALVDIEYDLIDADGDPCTVSVVISADGGSTWAVHAVSFTGDVGAWVTPGTGKKIVWDSAADSPGFAGVLIARVIADDRGTPPGMLLIPGGEFEMGDHHDSRAAALPIREVRVDPFYMHIHEVTQQDYVDGLNWAESQGLLSVSDGRVYDSGGNITYCDTIARSSYSRITWDGSTFAITGGRENHPIVMVSWCGAAAYANWRSTQEGRTPSYDLSAWVCNFNASGYRLPTEAEWEFAARGGEQDPYYRYPWGDTMDGSKANYWYSGDPFETENYPRTTPVTYYDGGQSPPGSDMVNGYGLYDMAGNAWEWCNDWYGPYTQCDPAPCDNPRGPATGEDRILRGGSWADGYVDYLGCASRFQALPDDPCNIRGFRLVVDSY